MERYYNMFKKYITGSIIDVGCGEGEWLKYLQSKGHGTIYGIDRKIENITSLRESGINGEVMILENITVFIMNQFDTVCCLDILDKFRNRHSLIRSIEWLMHEKSHLIFNSENKVVIDHLLEIFDLVEKVEKDGYVVKRRKDAY